MFLCNIVLVMGYSILRQLNISVQIKQSYLFDLFSKVITDH